MYGLQCECVQVPASVAYQLPACYLELQLYKT